MGHDGYCTDCGRPSAATDLCPACQHREIDGGPGPLSSTALAECAAHARRLAEAAYQCPQCGLMTLVWYDHRGRPDAAIPHKIICTACGHRPEVDRIQIRVLMAEDS